jgi:hypothetical protein
VIVISNALALAPGGNLLGTPIFGWRTIAIPSSISATTVAEGFPASNLANPSTALRWKAAEPGSPPADEFLTVAISQIDPIDYLAIAVHNLGSGQNPLSVEGNPGVDAFTKSLLPLFTDLIDLTGKVWTPAGNAAVSGGALVLDGAGDYATTPDHADLNLGSSDWAIECQAKCEAPGGTTRRIAGQSDNAGTATSISFGIERDTTNVIRAFVCQGSNFFTCVGTTQFTSLLNTDWFHVRFVRAGNLLKLFVRGIQEGSSAAFTGAVNNSANALSVGRLGEVAGSEWQGRIRNFRISVGTPRSAGNFAPPPPDVPLPWLELVQETLHANDDPIIFRFEPQSLTGIRLRIQPGILTPSIAVLYVGKLLVAERGTHVDHVPINLVRTTRVMSGKSETGNFVGRVVLSEARGTTFVLHRLAEAWTREQLEPFLKAAREIPFFFAWRPQAHSKDVGYCWLTEDPQPSRHFDTGTYAITLQMSGVAV